MSRCRSYPLCSPEGCWSDHCPVGADHDTPADEQGFIVAGEDRGCPSCDFGIPTRCTCKPRVTVIPADTSGASPNDYEPPRHTCWDCPACFPKRCPTCNAVLTDEGDCVDPDCPRAS